MRNYEFSPISNSFEGQVIFKNSSSFQYIFSNSQKHTLRDWGVEVFPTEDTFLKLQYALEVIVQLGSWWWSNDNYKFELGEIYIRMTWAMNNGSPLIEWSIKNIYLKKTPLSHTRLGNWYWVFNYEKCVTRFLFMELLTQTIQSHLKRYFAFKKFEWKTYRKLIAAWSQVTLVPELEMF